MKYDIILSGVGGQGVLSLAAIVAKSAITEGLHIRQSENHGMAQRGGAVVSHLRISDNPVASDLIGYSEADMILSMEPLESLRYTEYLSPDGIIVSAKEIVENITDYPDKEMLFKEIKTKKGNKLVSAGAAAKEAGSLKAVNMVMVGAASSFLPVKAETLERTISEEFKSKGDDLIKINIEAFRLGQKSR